MILIPGSILILNRKSLGLDEMLLRTKPDFPNDLKNEWNFLTIEWNNLNIELEILMIRWNALYKETRRSKRLGTNKNFLRLNETILISNGKSLRSDEKGISCDRMSLWAIERLRMNTIRWNKVSHISEQLLINHE